MQNAHIGKTAQFTIELLSLLISSIFNISFPIIKFCA